MLVKTKALLYIFGLAILAGVFAVFGFWYQAQSQGQSLFDFSRDVKEQKFHRAYSMDVGFYDSFFTNNKPKEKIGGKVFSAVVPHHLVAGRYLGSFFQSLEDQDPQTVVIIGPNHKQIGNDSIISSPLVWQTPYGVLANDKKLVTSITDKKLATNNEVVMGDEHSISTLVPFVKKIWPNVKVVPIILKNNTDQNRIDELIKFLVDSKENILVLVSVDFSHYLPKSVADFHDELSLNVLESGSQRNLQELEVDSMPSLSALLKYNKLKEAENFTLFSHSNSGEIVGKDLTETTSHIIGAYTRGFPTKKPAASLLFFGDIMLERNVAKAMGSEGLDYLFANLHGQENRFFEGQHILMANLEGPFAPTRVPTTKSIAFRFDPKLAKDLKTYGFDAFNLANNHTVDMGWKNVDFTKQVLKDASLGSFGDQYGEEANDIYIVGEDKNLPFKIAFIGLNTVGHELDMSLVKQMIIKAKQQAKFLIINIHWGEEYQQKSNKFQQDLGHQLIDLGADAIIGHHPHVVEEMEVYKGHPIFYSLGNFIFDQYFSKETQEGISVGLIIADDGKIIWHVFPFFSKKSQVQLMLGAQREKFMDWFEKGSRI
jgi:AmmeMemoRadiSam system protein B